MADHMMRDRQDAPIWNAIEAGNYKQALKLVDKRLAKKQTDYLEALKLLIRARSPLVTEKAAVVAHLEELPQKKPILTDLEIIELYEEAFSDVLPGPQESWDRILGELRWQCVKALPKNEDLSKKCFEACLAKDDIDHARQISNSLEKTFPNTHAYIFWNIAAEFLYSVSSKYPENQRKLWGTLAFRQIQNLAAATKQAADSRQLPVRSIHTPQEILLLHRITEALGKPEERLDYLRDPTLGPESVIAKGEWQLWRFRVALLVELLEWKELFDTTKSLLKRARTKDEFGQLSESGFSDWIVWEAFIHSAVELQGSEHKDSIFSEIEAHLDPACGADKSWKRNASLAWVKASFDSSIPFSLESGSSDRTPIILKYLKQHGSASTAFDDLKVYVQRLRAEERKSLLEIVGKNGVFGELDASKYKPSKEKGGQTSSSEAAKKISEHINSFKLRYLLQCSIPENERRQKPAKHAGPTKLPCFSCGQPCFEYCQSCLKSLAEDSAKLYLTASEGGRSSWDLLPTDRHPADDLAVLASMCLIKLSLVEVDTSDEPLSSRKTSYLLQAVTLLEQASTFSKSNYQIWLSLTRLYKYLGGGLLAMRAYDGLALKQVQLDTLSYTMFDRLSSFHPQPFNPLQDSLYLSPVDGIKKQQKLYRGTRGQISWNTWLSYKHGSYNTAFELKEVAEKLNSTIAASMSVVELRRISRLIPEKDQGSRTDGGYDVLAANPEQADTKISDTNDYKTFPNYESTLGPSFEVLSRFVPGPSEYRTRINLISEHLISLISAPPNTLEAVIQYTLTAFLSNPPQQPQTKNPLQYLTKPENYARRSYDDISLVIYSSLSSDLWTEQKFATQLEAYNTDLISNLTSLLTLVTNMNHIVPAFGDTLHTLYIAYDLSRISTAFCKFLTNQGSKAHVSQAAHTVKILETAKSLSKAVVEKVVVVKKGMDEGGLIDKVLDSVNGGNEEGEGFVGMLDAGALEVWAGDLVESWRDALIGLGLLRND
ncbi:N-acetyltransferase B complex non catalytic subunit-domain-containing protein [Amylocarpus encephaloides]|uniref:N-acetyltransferase B complex non catalytic subunit-domain-containing protein n=1 Tax=Amylocarpus encephaloides TaxID=45428 RepID=A0A9P8C830_9HELO|nr:N-acetyltransferase B complex non catalytic subunit-domain-containing protein [Amylocarpus encephaloides]